MPDHRESTGLRRVKLLDTVADYGSSMELVNNLVGRHLSTSRVQPLASVRHTGARTVIPIRVERDITRVCELAHDVAATIPFSAEEQSRLAAAVSKVARVVLDSPQHGYLAVAILRERETAGVAIAVRFLGEGQGDLAKSSPGYKGKGRLHARSIEEIGGDFDRFEKSEVGGDLLVTLVQWKREGEPENSASAGADPVGS